jgi:hypothetical protein
MIKELAGGEVVGLEKEEELDGGGCRGYLKTESRENSDVGGKTSEYSECQ